MEEWTNVEDTRRNMRTHVPKFGENMFLRFQREGSEDLTKPSTVIYVWIVDRFASDGVEGRSDGTKMLALITTCGLT